MTAKQTRPDSQKETRPIHIRLKPGTHKRLRARVAEEDASIPNGVASLVGTALATPKSGEAPRKDVP
ncbi:MAG: hypothetical protein ACOX5G_09445 [Kiritimatiellia bacterium]|jgi:hypothetical protein